MERPSRTKGSSMMNYFSKAATFSVSNPPHSPGRRSERGFSGPIVSIIPKEARHRKRSDSIRGGEPSSPKISCMGQIKPKRKKKSLQREQNTEKAAEKSRRRAFCSCFMGMFRRRVRPGGTPETEVREKKVEKEWLSTVGPKPTGQSMMRRYQSGRETLGDFDWTKNMEGNLGDEEEDMGFIPHSAPILMGRETMAMDPKASKPASRLSKMTRYQSGREKLGDFDWTKEMQEKQSQEEGDRRLAALDQKVPGQAPELSKMRKYHSGRETLGDFDWTNTMEENYGDEEEAFVPHSAPMMLVGKGLVVLEPKKDVSLWRRRETTPPVPLQIEKI